MSWKTTKYNQLFLRLSLVISFKFTHGSGKFFAENFWHVSVSNERACLRTPVSVSPVFFSPTWSCEIYSHPCREITFGGKRKGDNVHVTHESLPYLPPPHDHFNRQFVTFKGATRQRLPDRTLTFSHLRSRFIRLSRCLLFAVTTLMMIHDDDPCSFPRRHFSWPRGPWPGLVAFFDSLLVFIICCN